MNAPEKAQRAMLDVIGASSAKLIQRAEQKRDWLWKWENLTETEFNAAMVEFCTTELCDGDKLKGALLASAVMA